MRCFRKEEEKTKAEHKNIFIYVSQYYLLAILMIYKFKNQCFKSAVLRCAVFDTSIRRCIITEI